MKALLEEYLQIIITASLACTLICLLLQFLLSDTSLLKHFFLLASNALLGGV